MSVVQLYSAQRTLYPDGVATSFVVDLSKELAQSNLKGKIGTILQTIIVAQPSAATLTPSNVDIQGDTIEFSFSSVLPGNGTLIGGYVTVNLSLGIDCP